ncbi:protein bunched, class 1/class 3/D/E isoforms isoform X9 [Drosophila pseudoobscura]|uniref:Protein bunched, class 1/class 3/D/E isoforms isoform X9 n=1 Tax=Drosophila pseudoobscura pseudoobscura TaxID=46245 RepID=A0A6I8VVQ4_DROPS|nr:protein bunched, class 1/class 3/D/E isoforms isoform X9 [Drosophila pseudoobscura]
MKTETGSNINNNNNSIINSKMDFDMYPSISGKQQDPVREVVMKYIDYFLPDASGTSAVAIDNKIEQAMDLVKSHLMIAVREEVEVLKERISELMDKINKLELENNILKSNIPQETLQQLQMQLQIAGTQQPAAVGAPPATPAIQAPPAATAAVAVAAVAAGAGQAAVATVGAATSPATAAAPTTIPNGSAENGSSVIVDAVAAVEQQVQSAAAAAAAASGQTAPVNTNGPMS